jgi:hypothetical protein
VTGYRITFSCGRSQEPWSPLSVSTGIGGSQETLIAMARALRQLGHNVRVYSSCAAAAGEYDGVAYEDYRVFGCQTSADLIEVWRRSWLANSLPADVPSVLWLKDMVEPRAVTAAAHLYRKIFIQSRFHRQYYSGLAEEKFFYTRNGIHPEHFDQAVERDPYKVVYGSSYDRGLLHVLKAWPRVSAKVPEAHLTVCYGFEAARARAFQLVRPSWRSYRQREPDRILEIYPTVFPETSCITAMKAQAAGALPVVIPSGAVDETVQFGAKTTTSVNDYPRGQLPRRVYEEWEELLISNLRDPAKLEPLRVRMAVDARQRFALGTVAREWSAEFTRILGG